MKSINIGIGMVLLLCAIACQQKPVSNQAVLTAQISGLTDSIVEVQYYQDSLRVQDTVKVIDGKFTWTKEMPEPQQITVLWSTSQASFFVEKGNITLNASAEKPESLTVIGSATQDENAVLKKTSASISSQMDSLYRLSQNAGEEQAKDLERQLDELYAKEEKLNTDYINSHPESFVSLSLLASRAMFGTAQEISSMYNKLAPAIQNSQAGKRLAQRIEVLKRSSEGATVINFIQADTEGKPVQFSDFKGKYVLIDFWASWCGPCRAENPNVLRAFNQYKDKGFTVLGISLDHDKEKWMKAIKEDGMPWTQLSDLQGFSNEVSQYYGIQGIPSSLLVDPQGKILAKDLRGEALQQKLAEVLK